jgi:drug/metabolite transporter (DMT)-like permease
MNARSLFAALFTIVVWASLALLTDRVKHLPPLLSSGLALMVGGMVGAWQPSAWRAPLKTYVLGVGGLFVYHALLFAAFGLAPAVEVNLLQYLWPLLIVMMTPLFLPGKRLGIFHVVGAVMGCGGAALILGGGKVSLSGQYALGYFCAIAAAFVWAAYSLGCRRLASFPTSAIAACCLLAGIASILLHLALYGPGAIGAITGSDAMLIIGLGLGPMGVAFLTWDIALKNSDPRAIGALAYLIPLLSTVLLTQVNGHSFNTQTQFAAGAILLGAILGNMRMSIRL